MCVCVCVNMKYTSEAGVNCDSSRCSNDGLHGELDQKDNGFKSWTGHFTSFLFVIVLSHIHFKTLAVFKLSVDLLVLWLAVALGLC